LLVIEKLGFIIEKLGFKSMFFLLSLHQKNKKICCASAPVSKGATREGAEAPPLSKSKLIKKDKILDSFDFFVSR